MTSHEFQEWLVYFEWEDYFANKGKKAAPSQEKKQTRTTLGRKAR